MKVASFADLYELRDQSLELIKLRADDLVSESGVGKPIDILVCGGTGCHSSDSAGLITELRKKIESVGLKNVNVVQTGCFGFCARVRSSKCSRTTFSMFR